MTRSCNARSVETVIVQNVPILRRRSLYRTLLLLQPNRRNVGNAARQPTQDASWRTDQSHREVFGLLATATGPVHRIAVFDHPSVVQHVPGGIAQPPIGLVRRHILFWEEDLLVQDIQLLVAHGVHHQPVWVAIRTVKIEKTKVHPDIQWPNSIGSCES